jgi:two-component system CheB/CheR fusion protein
MRMMPYRTVDNVIGGVVITFTDVTQITAAETRIAQLTLDLRNRLESLHTLLDLVPVGVLTMETAEPQQVEVNRYGARLLGQDGGDASPRRIQTQFRLLDSERTLAAEETPLQRAMRTGQPVPGFEGRLERSDGSAVDVFMAATPLFDERGTPRGAMAVLMDGSQRKPPRGRR